MKKVKIMLFSIAIFAIVGVALAFKAKGVEDYCFTISTPIAGTCPFDCPIDGTGDPFSGPLVCYTFPEAISGDCDNACQFNAEHIIVN